MKINHLKEFLDFLHDNTLRITEGRILAALYERSQTDEEPHTHTTLAAEIQVSTTAATTLVDRLETRGLVRRQDHPHDRRVKQIALTDKGQHILEESISARQSWLGDLAETFSEHEKEPVIEALNTLIDKACQLKQA